MNGKTQKGDEKMNEYKVTIYQENRYGAYIPYTKIFRATSLDALYEILRLRGCKKYFIGSLLEPAYEK
jgi:hypothetical protein